MAELPLPVDEPDALPLMPELLLPELPLPRELLLPELPLMPELLPELPLPRELLLPELPLPMALLPLAEPLVDGEEVEVEPDAAVFSFGCPVALSRQCVAGETAAEPALDEDGLED